MAKFEDVELKMLRDQDSRPMQEKLAEPLNGDQLTISIHIALGLFKSERMESRKI